MDMMMNTKSHVSMIMCCWCSLVVIMTQLPENALSQVQTQTQSQQECMNNLQPCLNYLSNNRNPPDTCCRPLDYVVKSMPECLCGLMTIQGSNQAQRAGINVTQAQTLPGRCGLRINPLGCITGTPDTHSPSTSSATITITSSSISTIATSILVILLAL